MSWCDDLPIPLGYIRYWCVSEFVGESGLGSGGGSLLFVKG